MHFCKDFFLYKIAFKIAIDFIDGQLYVIVPRNLHVNILYPRIEATIRKLTTISLTNKYKNSL